MPVSQLNAVQCGGFTQHQVASPSDFLNTTRQVLNVLASNQNRQVDPWVIMQRPVIVASQESVQVNIEPAIARNDVPAF
jgi:hypothetical protein